jgi:hypothetical protein
MAIGRYEFRTCALSFFEPSHTRQLAIRGASAQKSPRESPMVNLQKGDRDDARWERVFQEKFAVTRILKFETLSWLGPLS